MVFAATAGRLLLLLLGCTMLSTLSARQRCEGNIGCIVHPPHACIRFPLLSSLQVRSWGKNRVADVRELLRNTLLNACLVLQLLRRATCIPPQTLVRGRTCGGEGPGKRSASNVCRSQGLIHNSGKACYIPCVQCTAVNCVRSIHDMIVPDHSMLCASRDPN